MTTNRARRLKTKARETSGTKRTRRVNFTRRTVAYRTLKEMFESGDITGMEAPSVVYNMNDVFRKYNIDQFRTGYNNFKQDFLPKNGSLTHQITNFVTF